jgi:glycine cleavage system H protein
MPSPSELRFATTHEWITPGVEIATVGISDHAQAELGDVVYLELPEVGRVVQAKEAVTVIESVKAASDIYAPVDGEIIEVNSAAADDTSLVNSSPYENGWLFKIKVADPAQVDALLTEAAYLEHIS